MVKCNIETSHTDVNTANFKIIDLDFSNNKRKQKIAESLWMKDLRPKLNVQDVTAFIIQDLADVLGICEATRNTLYGIMLLKLFMMKLKME